MKVAVVGGGITGLSTAYNLAKSGVDVMVFEKRYLVYGASGRNSGGITAQMENKAMVELAKRSIELYEKLPSEFGFNFLFRRDGYIKVARNEKDIEILKKEVKLQNSMGIKSRMLEPSDVKEMIPDFNADSIIGGTFSDGGVIFPWAVIWGYAKRCKELGVDIKDYTEVTEIVVSNKVEGLKTKSKFFKVDFIVNAAGAWSNEISNKAGIGLENKIIKEEICVTESLKPWLDPYLLDVTTGVYLNQAIRGEIIGGIVGTATNKIDMRSSFEFLMRYAKKAVELIPKLKGLSILRQWAGVYDVGKDGLPVIGSTELEGFVQANGFGKYGMCIAPAAGEIIAELIIKGRSRLAKHFSPKRFA
jgi:sarcosine oxidase subunit beta